VKEERTIEIGAPPERVYDLVMDPRRLEDWVTIHHHLEEAPPGQLEQGSHLTQCLKLAGRKLHVRWTVVENRPCEQVVWEGRGPVASQARVVYGFQPNGAGTRFTYLNEYELPGGWLGRIAERTVARVTDREVDATMQKLKSLLE
jgi:carbon monoxide dehydrogenase subunit G